MSEAMEVDASINNVESTASQSMAPHQHHQHTDVSLAELDDDHSVNDDNCASCCHMPLTHPSTPLIGMPFHVRGNNKFAPLVAHLASLSTAPLIRPPIA